MLKIALCLCVAVVVVHCGNVPGGAYGGGAYGGGAYGGGAYGGGAYGGGGAYRGGAYGGGAYAGGRASGQYIPDPLNANYPAIPFNFNYVAPAVGGSSSREESGDGAGRVTGSYTINDADGRFRKVNYVADAGGFRAQVETNEPGTLTSNPADAPVRSNAPAVNYGAGGSSYGASSNANAYKYGGGYGAGAGGYGAGVGGYGAGAGGYGAGAHNAAKYNAW